MSENSTPEQRTEMPTDRRMGEVRKAGQIFLSTELVQLMTLLAGFLMLQRVAGPLFEDIRYVMKRSYEMIANKEPLTVFELREGFIGLLYLFLPDIILLVLVIAAVAGLSVMLQTGWNIKEKKIDFRWNFMNPIGGVRRIFSAQGAINTAKSLVKLALILPVGILGLKSFAPDMLQLIHLPLGEVFRFTSSALSALFWKVFSILLVVALFDYFYGKFRWLKDNKMTKEEVKDERKAVEGDETVRRKIINKGMSRLAQRIFQSVPKADVVITNPTHYAVAIKYDRGRMGAPIVVAKGKGFIALKIREIAKESGVPILERKALARALFASTKVGSEIPYELFKAVAEVLAYVYRLKNPSRANSQTASR